MVHDPPRDLKAKADLPKLEPKESEPVRDLTNDTCCAEFENEASDMLRAMERPSD